MVSQSVALSRLHWVEQQYALGRNISMSCSKNKNTEKVKFVIHDMEAVINKEDHDAPILEKFFATIRHAFGEAIVTDKGHYSHSNRRSIAEFWIRKVRRHGNDNTVDINSEDLPPVPPPVLETALDLNGDTHADGMNAYAPEFMPFENCEISSKLDMTDQINGLEAVVCGLDAAINHMMMTTYMIYNDQCNNDFHAAAATKEILDKLAILENNHNETLDSMPIMLQESRVNVDLPSMEPSCVDARQIPNICELLRPVLSEMQASITQSIDLYAEASLAMQAGHDDIQLENTTTVNCINCHLEELRYALHSYNEYALISKESTGVQTVPVVVQDALEMPAIPDVDIVGVDDASNASSEGLLSLAEAQCRKDNLYRKRVRVVQDGDISYGTIIGISVGEQSGQRIYRVLHDDGDYQDFTRYEVQQWVLLSPT